MKSSNAENERRIRNFSVHLTRLTNETIDRIRCQLKRKAKKKANDDPKTKTKKRKSSNNPSFAATTSSANCISESAGNISLGDRPEKPAKSKSKKKPTSSLKVSKKKKSSPLISSKPSSKKVTVDACRSTWDDQRSYSTSEESELEEVFVPRKIWVKPSARPMSPTLSKPNIAAGSETSEILQQETEYSGFLVRRPVILLKKMKLEADTESEISSLEAVSGLHEGELGPIESADEKLPRHFQTVDQSCERDDKPILTDEMAQPDLTSRTEGIAISGIATNSKITGSSPLPCSCQLVVASPNAITSAVQTDKPKASTQSAVLINELAETCAPNTVPLRDTSAAERNQSDDAILSPVIFDEGSQATQHFHNEAFSPIIFGSNESAAAESVQASNGSNDQCQEAISDACNFSSSFTLELSTNEQSEMKVPSKNHNLTSDASQNFNLQLSENVPHRNIQSKVNSQESVSSSMEIPDECTIKDSASTTNSQLSSYENTQQSLSTNQCTLSEIEATCTLSGLGAANVLVSEKNSRSIKEVNSSRNQNVHSSTLNDESHLENNKTWSSALKPSNPFTNQKILVYSVKSLDLKSQKNPLSSAKPSHLLRTKSYLSGLEASSMSKTKSFSSVMKLPSFSKSGKNCRSVSDAANMCRKSYSSPLECLKPLSSPKTNLPPKKDTQLPASVPINSNDAFTQTDHLVVPQQPSPLSVNYIINSSSVNTIRFEGPVVNPPSTMTAVSEKISASDSTSDADQLHCPRVFSPNRAMSISGECNERNIFHSNEVPDLPKSYSQMEKSSNELTHAATNSTACHCVSTLDSRRSAKQCCRNDATKTVIDLIDLTDDEPNCGESSLGKIRLKTPSELGCTIAFTDDVERLFRHELPKLQCNFDKLELLKKKHINIFKFVLAKYAHGIPVNDTLQELYSTRSVPCGSNLLRYPSSVGLAKSPVRPNLTSQRSFYGNSRGIVRGTHNSMLVRGHHSHTTVLGKPIC